MNTQTYKTMFDMPDIRGKRVLVRSELNVPIHNGAVADAFRIEQAIPTLERLSSKGARIVVCAHIGRDPSESLEPVAEYIQLHHLPQLQFVPEVVGGAARQAAANLSDGDILLLQNVRSDPRETENSPAFAEALAEYADYFVSDAFGATHRAHASVVGVAALLPCYAGLLLEKELAAMQWGLSPQQPSLLILGGAKFATKEALLHAALDRYDVVALGGALANDFLKAAGHEVGESLVSSTGENVAALLKSEKLLLPKDVVVVRGGTQRTVPVDAIEKDEKIVDIGPETVELIGKEIVTAETIIWNGPMGLYEGGFTDATKSIAQYVAKETGESLVGGGDTVAAIRELGLADQFSFLSTGGGAMLDYLADGHVPGVDVLVG